MVNHFKRSWEADREKEKDISFDAMEGIVEDVLENDPEAIKNLVADEVFSLIETHVRAPKLKNVCDKIFGQWDWISNVAQCNGGCRITVGWNSEVVQVVLMHSTRQMMLCLIENIQSHNKMYCSFIYAGNKGMDRRALWKDLVLAKHCTTGNPWFLDCVNNIGVEDLCMSGMFYTWIKSPSSPNTSILKKLDKVMANDEFTSKFKNDHVVFYPFIVSDHSPAVLIIPQGMIKRKKSFKFANFIYEKSDFIPILLKKPLNNLQWKNGDVFKRVTCLRNMLKSDQLEVSLFPHDTEKKKIVVSIFEEFSEAVEDEEKFLF
ncbi:RNA-directed DNA polymerase, eukaryota, reverse transcriptase zinc-binding domain protein [Tanacetum coccineum]